MTDMSAFLRDTLHRMCAGAARFWVIEHHQRTGKIPTESVTYFAYPNGPGGFDWGNAAGPDDPVTKPLRGKRVRITLSIENH